VVRVNDRGPFLRGRLIDLSYAAAHRLGYVNAGSAMVEVEAITHEDIRVAMASGRPAAPAGGPAAVETLATRREAPLEQVAIAPLPAVAPAPPAGAAPAAAIGPALPARTSGVASSVAAPPAGPMAQPAARVGAAAPGSGAYLQLGAFSTPANAEDLFARARARLDALADRLHLLDDGGRYRLQIGPFASADEARLAAARIGALLDLQPFLVMR
ncbi:MAG TPA: SPOR domain-containing protein, partial [Rhodocyclaceae bacterium]|nr:SPOR domain-containing protein [Rhodocyclaceae bacterium]